MSRIVVVCYRVACPPVFKNPVIRLVAILLLAALPLHAGAIGTYSKPLPTALLVSPIVLLAWTRRRWARGFALGATAVMARAEDLWVPKTVSR